MAREKLIVEPTTNGLSLLTCSHDNWNLPAARSISCKSSAYMGQGGCEDSGNLPSLYSSAISCSAGCGCGRQHLLQAAHSHQLPNCTRGLHPSQTIRRASEDEKRMTFSRRPLYSSESHQYDVMGCRQSTQLPSLDIISDIGSCRFVPPQSLDNASSLSEGNSVINIHIHLLNIYNKTINVSH